MFALHVEGVLKE